MNNLPNELNYLIGDYLFKCRKNTDYIINKEFYNECKNKTKNCKKIYLLKKIYVKSVIKKPYAC